MLKSKMTRRRFLATPPRQPIIAMPYVRGAHAAGKLSIGFWDHWVPGANNASKTLCEEWAAKEKVEVSIDYITSQGNKNSADHRRRGAGAVGPRHLRLPDAGGRPTTPTAWSRSTTSWRS